MKNNMLISIIFLTTQLTIAMDKPTAMVMSKSPPRSFAVRHHLVPIGDSRPKWDVDQISLYIFPLEILKQKKALIDAELKIIDNSLENYNSTSNGGSFKIRSLSYNNLVQLKEQLVDSARELKKTIKFIEHNKGKKEIETLVTC